MTARMLYKWAKNDKERIAMIREWQTVAIMAIAEGRGKEVVATAGNGLSVSFAGGSTVSAWLETVTLALDYIAAGGIHSRSSGALI